MRTPMNKLLLVLAVALAVSAPAFAGPAAKLPADLPPYGQDKPIPVPEITQAVEREMIARRAKLFDQQNKLGYVYLISQSGSVLGYYTIFGKMASLNSYLVPQEKITDERVYRNSDGSYTRSRIGGYFVMDDADLDGTYGSNIEGVFFFTDNGTYVELPTTAGVTPIYSDKPLPIHAAKLN